MFDVDAYLRRIDYHGSTRPSAETLRVLQQAHLRAVPFENLDIHLGRPIVLDENALFDKIVNRRRGGFCYELNGLFAGLLRRLGFVVSLLSARVRTADGGFGPEFDHLALLVPLAERWLVDVGFGDGFERPLRLDERGEQVEGTRAFQIRAEGDEYVLWQQEGTAGWGAQYRFDERPRRFEEFAGMCHYHQTSSDSPFPRRRVCSQATAGGRVTLSGRQLIVTGDGQRLESELPDEVAFDKALREHFGLSLAG